MRFGLHIFVFAALLYRVDCEFEITYPRNNSCVYQEKVAVVVEVRGFESAKLHVVAPQLFSVDKTMDLERAGSSIIQPLVFGDVLTNQYWMHFTVTVPTGEEFKSTLVFDRYALLRQLTDTERLEVGIDVLGEYAIDAFERFMHEYQAVPDIEWTRLVKACVRTDLSEEELAEDQSMLYEDPARLLFVAALADGRTFTIDGDYFVDGSVALISAFFGDGSDLESDPALEMPPNIAVAETPPSYDFEATAEVADTPKPPAKAFTSKIIYPVNGSRVYQEKVTIIVQAFHVLSCVVSIKEAASKADPYVIPMYPSPGLGYISQPLVFGNLPARAYNYLIEVSDGDDRTNVQYHNLSFTRVIFRPFEKSAIVEPYLGDMWSPLDVNSTEVLDALHMGLSEYQQEPKINYLHVIAAYRHGLYRDPSMGFQRRYLMSIWTWESRQLNLYVTLWKQYMNLECAFYSEPISRLGWDDYREAHKCPAEEPQIAHDLLPWTSTNSTIKFEDLEGTCPECPGGWARMRVRILKNRLYVSYIPEDRYTKTQPEWYEEAIIQSLLALLDTAIVPDVDFVLALGELPVIFKGQNLPVFSMIKTDAHMDILFPEPFFHYWSGLLPIPHPYYRPPSILAFDDVPPVPWEKKIPKLFWRGSVEDFSDNWNLSTRVRLVRMGLQHPDLIDAAITRIVSSGPEATAKLQAEIGVGTYVPMKDQNKWKYLMYTHGNGNQWSNRLRVIMLSGSAIFMQEALMYEFWYRDIRPWEHYIPVKEDYSNLLERLKWAADNEEAVQEMVARAKALIQERLAVDRVKCYWHRLLWDYSKIQGFTPKRNMGVTRYWYHHHSAVID